MRRLGFIALLVVLAACERERPVTIEFRAEADGVPIRCVAGGRALTDLRFYVHDVALIGADGEPAPVRMDDAAPWQTERLALIDLEDGEGACDSGSPNVRGLITGHARIEEYSGLTFTLGVPFDLNHANPVEAKAPLDQTVMHWHWLAGYKFMRAGLLEDGRQTWVHIGSTGCKGRVGAIEGCDRPNRIAVGIPGFDPDADVVAVDLGALFKGRDGDESCMSEPQNPTCDAIFANLDAAGVFGHAAR
jgi:uncharacterized repeat protein (TIGR04052 family)